MPALELSHVYKRFTIASGKKVTLRVLRWEDLDGLLSFINTLVEEKQRDSKSTLYTGFDRRVTRDEEAEWLAQTLVAIERESVINVIADIDGTIIANGDVTRGGYKDTHLSEKAAGQDCGPSMQSFWPKTRQPDELTRKQASNK